MIRTLRLRVYPGPCSGAAEIAATLAAVRRYKNKLTEIQREYRKKYQETRAAKFPAFAAAEAAYEQAAEALKVAEEATKKVRAQARKGTAAPPAVAAARAVKNAAAAVLRLERDKIDPEELKRVTAHLDGEEQAAVKVATEEAGLTSPTAYEARQDLQRAKKMAGAEGPRFRRPDGGGTLAVQVPAVDGSERILLDALQAADLHPSAAPVLREAAKIALVMGRPRFVGLMSYECLSCKRLEKTARKKGACVCGEKTASKRIFVLDDKASCAIEGKGDLVEGLKVWRQKPEARSYQGHSETARAQALSQLAPLRTWKDLEEGRLRDVSLHFLPRAEWRAAWPKGSGDRPSQKPPQGEREHGHEYAYGLLTIRVNREGATAVIPVKEPVERLPPLSAQIKQVELHVRRIGVTTPVRRGLRYSVLVTLDDPTDRPPQRGGVVAVNVGWRPRPDGSVRCAYYVGSDGQHGELAVPASILKALEKADHWRSIRDDRFDIAKAKLQKYLATLPEHPEWLVEGTKGLAHWRDGRRLERLLNIWRENRLPAIPSGTGQPPRPSDEEVFRALAGPLRFPEQGPAVSWRGRGDKRRPRLLRNDPGQDQSWLAKHRHLLACEQDMRRRSLARRKALFQLWGKQLAERYGVLLLEDFDLSKERRRPRVEEGTQKERTPLIKIMNAAAPGECRDWLAMAQERRGGEVVRLTVSLATQRCAHCQSEERWDASESVMHTCRSCGNQVDQDWQNCQNRLIAWLRTDRPTPKKPPVEPPTLTT